METEENMYKRISRGHFGKKE